MRAAARPIPSASGVTRWVNLSKTAPGLTFPQISGEAAYDEADGYVVLFTAGPAPLYLSQTWTYSDGLWTELNLTVEPPARTSAGITYDAHDGYVLLFGGVNYSNGFVYNDTWTFGRGVWANLSGVLPSHPSARYFPALAYDVADGIVLLFGGTNWRGPFFMNDTWSFVNGVWSKVSVPAASAPPGRYGTATTYDSADGYVLMYGGDTQLQSPCWETWSYSAGSWTNLTGLKSQAPGGGLVLGASFYDSSLGVTILFGGSPTRTWTYLAGSWTDITTQVGLPPPPSNGYNPAGVFDALDQTGLAIGPWFWSLGPAIVLSIRIQAPAIDLGQSITFNASAISASANLTLTWQGLPAGCSPANWTIIKCTPISTGRFTVNLTATNATGYSVNRSALVLVYPDPSVISLDSAPHELTLGDTTAFTVVTAGGVPPLNFTFVGLPAGCLSANRNPLLCTPTATGLFNVGVRAVDRVGGMAGANVTVQVNPRPSFGAFDIIPPFVDVGQSVTLIVNSSGGTPPLTVSYLGLPPGCTSADVFELVCSPQKVGAYPIVANLTDARGWSATANGFVQVDPQLVLVTYSASAPAVDVGLPVRLAVNYSGGTPGYTFSLIDDGMGCGSSGGASAQCTPSSPGVFHPSIRVTDSLGESVIARFNLTVNPRPTISSAVFSHPVVDLGVPTNLSVGTSGGTPPILITFSQLPPGCRPGGNATMTCLPTVVGNFSTRVGVADKWGLGAQQVVPVEVNALPSVVSFSVAPSTVLAGGPMQITTSLAGGTGPFVYSYSGLPRGCVSRDSAAWSCAPSSTGDFVVIVTARDSFGLSATGRLDVTVTPSLWGLPLTSALAGSITVSAAGLIGIVIVYRRRRRQSAGAVRAGREERSQASSEAEPESQDPS